MTNIRLDCNLNAGRCISRLREVRNRTLPILEPLERLGSQP